MKIQFLSLESRTATNTKSIRSRGFTLLELVVVVAVLAIVAGAMLWNLDGVEDRARTDIAKTDMMRIREAILQFRADTGYLPKQGPFALAADGGDVASTNVVPADYAARFASPAHLGQLFGPPVTDVAEESKPIDLVNPATLIRPWNPDTGRGWKGPYLSRRGLSQVQIGVGMGLDGSGTGPGDDAGGLLSNIPAAPDPFLKAPRNAVYSWLRDAVVVDFEGRPYFVLDLLSESARVVCNGANGLFENGAGDDLVLYLFR